ncbi:hypothetical protein [Nocardia miyunensis]|nr:hypothetical protein [Nocardia miyunensis]
MIGNAACLALAFVIALAVPGAGYRPLLLLLVDGPCWLSFAVASERK